ncbi:MAG: GHKL domain-containing protein [Flavobacteriales bacterium]|nr:GHKL domain-containing protein [Flavobacteriales bacterium]
MKTPINAVLVCCGILAAANVSAQDVVRVTRDLDYLGRHLHILEDPTATLGAEAALRADGYARSVQPVPNLGISNSAFWVKFDILNDTKEESVYLDLEHAEIELVDVYTANGLELTTISRTGQSRPLESRDMEQPEFVFDLRIPVNRTRTVLMRVESRKQLQLPVLVRTPTSFAEARSKKNLVIGMYVGIMLALALYNFFVFLSIRDRGYIVYVAYIMLVGLTQLAFWGIGQFYLWSSSPWFSMKASIVFTFATAVAASEFMKNFIDTRARVPGLHKGVKYFYALFAVVMVFYLYLDPSVGYKLAQLAAGLFASYMFYTIWKVWRLGSRQAAYFLIAWSVFLLGTMVFTLKDMGLLPYNDLTVFTMPLGSAVEGVLLSFALADRINILRKEKAASQAEALHASLENERIIREQNVMLEEKVAERTHALQESNEHLKQTQTQLVNAEKMASLGQLTAGIAHEINNPINFITSNIDPLKRNISEIVQVMQNYRSISEDRMEEDLLKVRELEVRLDIQESITELDDIIGSISEGSSRTAEIVRGLRNFSRLDEDDLKFTDLNEGLRSTLTLLSPQFRHKVSIELDLGGIPEVECFPGKVNQVFMNVITNGIQAAMALEDGSSAKLLITTRSVDDRVHVRIKDNGVGMSEEVKARIYDPFFTTKAVGEGTGLGLAIVYGIVEDHQGRISVESAPGEGTEFLIDLPVLHTRHNQRRA